MSKITREASKNRFKKGMYPTEQDFANLHDSYVHKDDTIPMDNIVSGDESLMDVINRKAEEKHEHAISEVEGLEDALSQVYAILGKANGETIAELASKFASLTNGYSDVYTFVETVKNFLEETDASNETINRWNEIENFLQGITDSETLTGLLENLKSEIMGEVENLLNDKADRSDLDSKANQSDLDNLQSTVDGYDSRISTVETSVSNLESSVSNLESAINDKADRSDLDSKANQSDLDNLQSTVDGYDSRISSVESSVSNLESSVSNLESTVNDKADRSDLDSKANQSDLDNLQSTVDGYDSRISTVETSVSNLESAINDKADTSTVNSIDERVTALENAEPVEQKEYTAGDGIDISEEGVISLKPEENKLDCIKLIPDLDACDAPIGTIGIYSGATNEKYTHGFFYENTGKEGQLHYKCVLHVNKKVMGMEPGNYTCDMIVESQNALLTRYLPYIGDNGITFYARYACFNFIDSELYSLSYRLSENAPGDDNVRFDGAATVERTVSNGGGWTPLNVMNVIG